MSAWTSLVPLVLLPLAVGAALPDRDTRLGTRWWFGAVATAVLLIVAHAIRLPQPVALGGVYVGAGVLLGLAAWRRARSVERTPRSMAGGLLIALLVPFVLAVVLYTLDVPALGADAIVIWYGKAKALYEWVPLEDLPFRNYPALGPASWMLVLRWVGEERENLGRLFFGASYVFGLLTLLELVRRPYPLWSDIALPLLAILFFDFGPMTRGDQDGLVMTAAGVATIFLVKTLLIASGEGPMRNRLSSPGAGAEGRQPWLLAAFFAGTLGLVKQEGTVLGLILLAAWLTALLVQVRWRKWPSIRRCIAPAVVIYLVFAALWPALLWLRGVDITEVQGHAFTVSSVLHAFDHLDRWPAVRPYLLAYYGGSVRPVLLACVVLSLAALWRVPWVRTAVLFLWGVLALHTVFVLFVFLSTRQALAWHLNTAADRLLSQNRFVFVILLWLTLATLLDPRARTTDRVDAECWNAGPERA